MAEFIHLLNSNIVGYFVQMIIEHLFAIIAVIMFKIKKKSHAALLLFAGKFGVVSTFFWFQL
jgi:hypothetical protein